MWSLYVPVLNRLIRDKPGVAPATAISACCVPPPSHVGLVRIRNPNGEPVEWGVAMGGEVKNKFMSVVHIALRVDRLEVAPGQRTILPIKRDRFDPVERILK